MKLDSAEVHGERPRLGAKLGDLISYQGGKKLYYMGGQTQKQPKML